MSSTGWVTWVCLEAALQLVSCAAVHLSQKEELLSPPMGPRPLTVVLPPFQPQKGKLTPSPVDFTITPETLQNVKEVFLPYSYLCVMAAQLFFS